MDVSMQEMEASSGQAQTCVQQANDARDALEQIQQVVSRIYETNEQIARVSDEQSSASDQALQSIQGIREATATMVSQLVASADMSRRLQALIQDLERAAAEVSVN
jgi:methyl-accepting chemotaxis protein